MTTQYGGWDWFQKAGLDASSNPVTDSRGEPAVNFVQSDKNISNTPNNRFIDTIGFNVPQDAVWTAADRVTEYRVLPSAQMRICEDAANDTQRDAWLNRNAANTGSAAGDLGHTVLLAGVWSEWESFPEGFALTSLHFSLDAAGTGATAVIQTR